jgi:4-hydroxy-3-polyprenylbenzoate decarboxylase
MVVLQWNAKTAEGDDDIVRASGLRILERFRMAKLLLSVDEDVDLESDPDLWWAMVTRMQGDRDVVVLPDREGFPLDPTQHRIYSPGLSADGRTAKVAFDATVPFAQRDRFRRPRFTEPVLAPQPSPAAGLPR